jgi:hypothetical protein
MPRQLSKYELPFDNLILFLSTEVRATFRHKLKIIAWMELYTMTFADIYRQHVYDWDFGDQSDVPEAWALSFEHATAKDLLILQNIVLGINGHINKDLSNALYQVQQLISYHLIFRSE